MVKGEKLRGQGAAIAAVIFAALSGACDGASDEARFDDTKATAGSESPWTVAGRRALTRAQALFPNPGRARNVILFIGDGMGISTVTAARILAGQQAGGSGEEHVLAWEALPHVALLKTYNTNQQVADSAGTITAMLTGVKTNAGVLSVDEHLAKGDHRGVATSQLRTLLEEAEGRGLATGVVSTARITHATPAAGYAHSPHRDWESDADLPEAAREADFPDIARQLVEFGGDGIEVALGGGRRAFLRADQPDPEYPERGGARRDGRDLAAEYSSRPGYRYVWNRDQLNALAALDRAEAVRVLGLFEPSHMRFEVDRSADPGGEPSLTEMTAFAIELLARRPRGYFLVVEGGRIDHGHHLTNAYRALTDTIELSNAVAAARELTRRDETLIVVTADHGHVFTLAGYPTRGNPILGYVIPNDANGKPTADPARDLRGQPFTTLGYTNGPGNWELGSGHSARARLRSDLEGGRTTSARPGGDPEHPDYRQHTAVPLPIETHSGEDVPLYAGGPGSALFHGVQEQSYVYYAIAAALGWMVP